MSLYATKKATIDALMETEGYHEAPTLNHSENAPQGGIDKRYSVTVAGLAETRRTADFSGGVPWAMIIQLTYDAPNPDEYTASVNAAEAIIEKLAAITPIDAAEPVLQDDGQLILLIQTKTGRR